MIFYLINDNLIQIGYLESLNVNKGLLN